jgi:hypothetical protein
VGAVGTGTTRGPGSRDSSPRPKARRFSASFSLTFAVVLSTVTAFDVVIKISLVLYQGIALAMPPALRNRLPYSGCASSHLY